MYPLEEIELIRNPPGDLDDIPAPAKNLRPFLWHQMGMSEENQRISLLFESEYRARDAARNGIDTTIPRAGRDGLMSARVSLD